MFDTFHARRDLGWRSSVMLLLLTMALGLATISPAHAVEAGAGPALGTEDQIDVADPANSGTVDVIGSSAFPLCAKAADNQYVDPISGLPDGDTLSASYTFEAPAGTFTAGLGAVYLGGVTIEIRSTAAFHFGPQGTHSGTSSLGADCGASNLGPLAPVPATITVKGGVNFNCSGNGGFWRAAGNAFGASVTLTGCAVQGNMPNASGSASATSTVTFAGNFQPPCGLPAPCIVGAYTQL